MAATPKPSKYVASKRHKKQHDVRAATFLRLSEACTDEANNFARSGGNSEMGARMALDALSRIYKDEATKLRSMR